MITELSSEMGILVTARCSRMSKKTKDRRKKWLVELYGNFCFYCNVDFDTCIITQVTVDHVLPRSHGGSNSVINLIMSCQKCNNARGDLPFEDFLAKCMDKFDAKKIQRNYITFLDLNGYDVSSFLDD